jgi:hypothetical protein
MTTQTAPRPAAVSLATIQGTIAHAIRNAPADRARIERAAALIALGHVQRTAIDEFTVESQTRIGTHYVVTPNGCTCVDAARRPAERCKHAWAARIVVAAAQDAAAARIGRAA